jgi:phosphatidylglycerol:prolipoprotein diacylglycerol transferase
MIAYPNIDPVIFHLGPLQIRWYGLMYVLGFVVSYVLVQKQIRRFQLKQLGAHFENLNVVLIITLVVGGRLGYVLFYNLKYYLQHPLEIAATWQGGMSFHGALIGLIVAGVFYCRRHSLDFWQTADIYVVTVPIGLGLGRIGNFLNGELFGRVTDVPWAMVFPGGGPLPRHPSQLYQCLLGNLKNLQHDRGWPTGTMLACFLIGYGVLRWFAELFREPDAHLGFLVGSLTMGQLLSGFMILAGILLLVIRRNTAGQQTG